jgi:cell division protein FtsB
MLRNKIRPRAVFDAPVPKPHNFFYRLVSSQRFLAIIGLVFLVLILFPLAKTYSQRRLVENEINDVKKQISDFEKKNKEINDMISYFQSPQYLEAQARLNLNLKKPGEEVVVIDSKEDTGSVVVSAPEDAAQNNYAKWWRYFFN